MREHPRFAIGAAAGAFVWFCANSLERVLVTARPLNVALEEGLEMFGASILLITFSVFFLDVSMGAVEVTAEESCGDVEEAAPSVAFETRRGPDVVLLDSADAHVGC